MGGVWVEEQREAVVCDQLHSLDPQARYADSHCDLISA